MAIIRNFGLAFGAMALCGALAGCANVPPPSPAVVAGLVQVAYAGVKADADNWVKTHPKDAAAVAKIEATLDPEIAALSSDQLPTTIGAAIGDLENGVNALPATVLSQAHKDEIDFLLNAAQMASVFIPVKSASPPAPQGGVATAGLVPAPVRWELLP